MFLCTLTHQKSVWWAFSWATLRSFTCNLLWAKSSNTSGRNWSWFLLRKLWTWWNKTNFSHKSRLNIKSINNFLANIKKIKLSEQWHGHWISSFVNAQIKLGCLPDTWQHRHSDILWTPAGEFWVWSSRDCCHGDSGISAGMYGLWPETENKGVRGIEKRLRLPTNPCVE